MGNAGTCRQPSTKQRSTLPKSPTPSGWESNKKSLHQTQGGSEDGALKLASWGSPA